MALAITVGDQGDIASSVTKCHATLIADGAKVSQCEFVVINENEAIDIDIADEVTVTLDGTEFFNGEVSGPPQQKQLASGVVEETIYAQGWGKLLHETVMPGINEPPSWPCHCSYHDGGGQDYFIVFNRDLTSDLSVNDEFHVYDSPYGDFEASDDGGVNGAYTVTNIYYSTADTKNKTVIHIDEVGGTHWWAQGVLVKDMSDQEIIQEVFAAYDNYSMDYTTNVDEIKAVMPYGLSTGNCTLAEFMQQVVDGTGERPYWWVDTDKALHYKSRLLEALDRTYSTEPGDVGGTTYRCWDVDVQTDQTLINRVLVVGKDPEGAVISTWVDDDTSKTTYGIKEAVIIDHEINTVAGLEDLGETIIDSHKDPKATVAIKSLQGTKPGQVVKLKAPSYGYDTATNFYVHKLEMHFQRLDGADDVIHTLHLGNPHLEASTAQAVTEGRIRKLERRVVDESPGSSGGGGGGDDTAQYLVLEESTELSNERVFVAGEGLSGTDVESTRIYTLDVDITNEDDLAAPALTDEVLLSDTSDGNAIKKADLASVLNLIDSSTGDLSGLAGDNLDWDAGDNAIDLGAHKDLHDPEDGADPLDCAAAGEIVGVTAAAEGSAHSFARSDHTHQIQHSISNNHIVTVDGSPNDNEYARWTANGLEGRTYAEMVDTDLAEEIEDLVGAMVAGNTETGITVTYQDGDGTIDFVVSDEWVEDTVGAMFSGNTETHITATYQDGDGTIDLVVSLGLNDLESTSLADPGADRIVFWDDSDGQFEFLTANTGLSISGNNLNCSVTDWTQEEIEDLVGAMFSGNTETLIAATYQDGDGTIDLVVDEASIDHDALTNFDANEHIDHTGVTLTAGNGLTGGGDISANRTFEVGAGDGITVNANDVALTTPGTLTNATSNDASGNHTHAITTTGSDTNIVSGTAGTSGNLARWNGDGDIVDGGLLPVGFAYWATGAYDPARIADGDSAGSYVGVMASAIGGTWTIQKMYVCCKVVGTNDSTNYWTIQLQKMSGTAIATVNTGGSSANVWLNISDTSIGTSVSTSDEGLIIKAKSTNSPGDLYIPQAQVLYYD